MSGGAHAVILVYSTSHALRGEKVLERAGIACKLIPVPRELSSDCGICIRVGRGKAETAEAALAEAGVGVEGTHDI